METKAEIRRLIQNHKKKLSQDEIINSSRMITKKLMELPEYKDAECIFVYVNFNEEVITKKLIIDTLESGKRVAIPKIRNQSMDFYYIRNLEDLIPSHFGILEPKVMVPAREEKALMVMPGLAFDFNGHRIGYGKGYYDSYLRNHLNYNRIALAYGFQVFEEIPYISKDITVHKIVTETEIITISSPV